MSTEQSEKREQLLRSLSRGIAYTAPLMIAVAGYAAVHSIVGDAVSERGYLMSAVGEGEGEAEGEARAEAEAAGEAEGEAEGSY